MDSKKEPFNQKVIDEKEICKRALETWGRNSQISMVFEEMSELQKELCKSLRGREVTKNIAEEVADLEIMLQQMKELFKIEQSVKIFKLEKLERLDSLLKELK